MPCLDDRPGNPLGKTFLTILLQYPGYLFLTRLHQPLRCGHTPGGIHAHIQQTFLLKTETASSIIELGRGYTEIQQDTVDTFPLLFGDMLFEVGKRVLHNAKAGIVGKLVAGGLQRLGVLVKGEQTAVVTQARENGRTVATASEGAVDITTIRFDIHTPYRLFQQNGQMFLFAVHGL